MQYKHVRVLKYCNEQQKHHGQDLNLRTQSVTATVLVEFKAVSLLWRTGSDRAEKVVEHLLTPLGHRDDEVLGPRIKHIQSVNCYNVCTNMSNSYSYT